MYPSKDVIYCLAEIGGAPFYVGRSIEWHNRWKSHIQSAKTGTEVKYQHIRKLWAAGSDFEMIILDEKPGERYEKYYHYLLGCEYDLTNMKMGDTWATEQAAGKRIRETGREFTGAAEFLEVLDREIEEEKARKKAARTQAKIRKTCETDDTSRTLFVGENPHTRFISPGLRALKEKQNGQEIQNHKERKY